MDHAEPSRIRDATAAAVCDRAGLGEAARGLLVEGMAPVPYLEALAANGLHADALRFLAFALPKREAVWWACVAIAGTLGDGLPPAGAAALEAARAWVIDPSDPRRRAAFPAAEAAGMGTPAGCTAAAAYFSGGSLAPPGMPDVGPPEHVTAHLAASALMLAAVVKEPEKAAEKSEMFLKTGREIAAGRHRWAESAPETAEGKPKAAGTRTEKERRLAELEARRARGERHNSPEKG